MLLLWGCRPLQLLQPAPPANMAKRSSMGRLSAQYHMLAIWTKTHPRTTQSTTPKRTPHQQQATCSACFLLSPVHQHTLLHPQHNKAQHSASTNTNQPPTWSACFLLFARNWLAREMAGNQAALFSTTTVAMKREAAPPMNTTHTCVLTHGVQHGRHVCV